MRVKERENRSIHSHACSRYKTFGSLVIFLFASSFVVKCVILLHMRLKCNVFFAIPILYIIYICN